MRSVSKAIRVCMDYLVIMETMEQKASKDLKDLEVFLNIIKLIFLNSYYNLKIHFNQGDKGLKGHQGEEGKLLFKLF